jgi:hypothetical protein
MAYWCRKRRNGDGADAQSPFRGRRDLGFLSGLYSTRRSHGAVAPFKFVHTPGRIDKLLFASEKRMARRTDANFDVVPRGAGAIGRTASAYDDGLDVGWMDRRLHFNENP